MGAVTYLPRLILLVMLSRRALPAWLAEWLELIQAAILSALIILPLLAQSDPRIFTLGKDLLLEQ